MREWDHLLASDRATVVVSAMWDICGRDKKVKLEMNDSVRDSGYWYLGTSRLNDSYADGPRASGAVHFKF